MKTLKDFVEAYGRYESGSQRRERSAFKQRELETELGHEDRAMARQKEMPKLVSVHFIKPEASKDFDPENKDHVEHMKFHYGAKVYKGKHGTQWGIPMYHTSGRSANMRLNNAREKFGENNITRWTPKS